MVSDEEALRRLQAVSEGTDPEPRLVFLGTGYEVRTDGRLTAVLAYAAMGQPSAAERARLESLGEHEAAAGPVSEQVTLSAAHALLEACLADFTAFSNAAMDGKATIAEVREAVMRVIEIQAARPPMPALRLLRHAVGAMAEIDGALLLAGGRGLASMSAREVCNAVFTRLLESTDPERQAEWKEDLYLDYSPADQALEMVRQMQADKARKEADASGHG